MPELGQWLLLVVIGLAVAAAIGWPLLRRGSAVSPVVAGEAEAEGRALRHRVALEGLLDVEADRRSGSLDDASYERERAEAEERAAETLIAAPEATEVAPSSGPTNGRRAAAWLGVGLAAALLVGFALPAPSGLAERTVVNQALADELVREAARQAEIQRLLTAFAADPQDVQVISDLADAYLAGTTSEDLRRAAAALQVLLSVEPGDESAYRRLITAYISAADFADAQAATDSFATIVGEDQPDIPFFRGLIAFRSGDKATAVRQFDRFLELAPDDDRAAMITSLRAEAGGGLPGASASPSG